MSRLTDRFGRMYKSSEGLGKPDIKTVFPQRLVTEADHLKVRLCIIDGDPLW
jgi:hypothetical protein